MTRVDAKTQSGILARRHLKPKPNDWRKQIRDAFRQPGELLDFLGLPQSSPPAVVLPAFPMMVPRAFAARMRPGDRQDPLLLQVLPDEREHEQEVGFVADPVGDTASRRSPGLLHKYRGRVLLITTGACAIHCRYCFRQAFPYQSDRASAGHWQPALDYIAARAGIDEVILSGGDPLMLSTRQLEILGDGLRGIGHIKRLRIHTRLPVVLPDRVNENLCNWISNLPWPVVVVIHANHAAEFDGSVDQAMIRLRNAGATLFNQTVLLAGINDRAETLIELMERSFAAHVIPYYLHLLDRVAGAARFDSDQKHALTLLEAMRVQLSGYLVPRLVREQAGAPYKLPIL
jgi:L-lysine 2,3-aminomutase